eukprot:GEMP01004764.1.p1 GENE.GEMP01004764.1~~GEMP01004764.1.p1  ORF type:complete len:923 (-),score=211.66 GEMP01004764.1:994-3762(-)
MSFKALLWFSVLHNHVGGENDVVTIIPSSSEECKSFFDDDEVRELVSQHLGTCDTCNSDQDDVMINHDLTSITDPTNLCRKICKSILIRKNENRVREDFKWGNDQWLEKEKTCLQSWHSPNEISGGKADSDATSCRIRTFCQLDECPAYNDMCHVIFKREVCKLRSRTPDTAIDIDCFIQLEGVREHVHPLTPEMARQLVNDAGIKAYNAAALREEAVCDKVGISRAECSFDRAFEVQAQRDLQTWFNERTFTECQRLLHSSPAWMLPPLNCDLCAGGDAKCDPYPIAARQMRIQYYQVRFVELLLIFHGGQDMTPVGALEWTVNYFQSQPGPECFTAFFQSERKEKGTYLHYDPNPPSDECIDALSEEMALMLSVDGGEWYRTHAVKLFDIFFRAENDETSVPIQPSLDVSNQDLFFAIQRVRNDAKLEAFQEISSEKAKDRVYSLSSSGDENEKNAWTVEVVKGMLKKFIEYHDRTLPFILQSEEVRHALWITYAFLERLGRFKHEPIFADIRLAIRDAKVALDVFREKSATTAEDCASAFYGDYNAGTSLHMVSRMVATPTSGTSKDAASLAKTGLLASEESKVQETFDACINVLGLSGKTSTKEADAKGNEIALRDKREHMYKELGKELTKVKEVLAQLTNETPREEAEIDEGAKNDNSAATMLDEIVQIRFGPYLVDLLGSLVSNYRHSKQHVHLLHTTMAGIFATREDRLYTTFLDLKFRWRKFLSQSEAWPDVMYVEVNDAGLAHRKKEMQFIQELCRIVKIDPYMAYTPPSRKLSSYSENGNPLQDMLSDTFDKQQCSLQHVLTRQYALKGRRAYELSKSKVKNLPEEKPTMHLLNQFKFPDAGEKSETDKEEREKMDAEEATPTTQTPEVETEMQAKAEEQQQQQEQKLLDREKTQESHAVSLSVIAAVLSMF